MHKSSHTHCKTWNNKLCRVSYECKGEVHFLMPDMEKLMWKFHWITIFIQIDTHAHLMPTTHTIIGLLAQKTRKTYYFCIKNAWIYDELSYICNHFVLWWCFCVQILSPSYQPHVLLTPSALLYSINQIWKSLEAPENSMIWKTSANSVTV